jgi:CO dehydrogenase maturation factor
MFRKDEVLLLDMYAGVEHLGRATVDFVDAMLIVVEPTRRSMGTAAQIKKLANDIGLNRLYLVGNKVRNSDEEKFLLAETPGLPVLGFLPADMGVQEADRLGIPVYDHVPALRESARNISELLVNMERS